MTDHEPRYSLSIIPTDNDSRDTFTILVNGTPAIQLEGYYEATQVLADALDVLERELNPINADTLVHLASGPYNDKWRICEGWN